MIGRDCEQIRWTVGISARLRALVIAAALVALAAPGSLAAQGLPSADDLETEDPVDEEVEPETPDDESAEDDASDESGAEKPAASDEATGEDEPESDEGADESGDEESAAAEEAKDGPATGDIPTDESSVDERLPGSGVNLEGARGFQHIASAAPGKPNTYRVGFLGSFTKGANVIRFRDQNEFVSGNLLFQATILEQLSANIGIGASNNVNTFGRPQAMLAQGDVHLGLRGHLNPTPGVYLAGDVTTFFPTGFQSAGLSLEATSVRPRLLVTTELGEFLPRMQGKKMPLKAHFNFGYLFDNTSALLPDDLRPTRVERFAHQVSSYDYLQLGLGFEYAFPYVAPFLSWNLDVPVNPDEGVCSEAAPLLCVTEEGFAGFPDKLSLGVRAEPVDNLGLTAGVDIGLSGADVAGIPVTPPWQMIIGASWAIDPEPKIEYVEKVVEKEKIVEKMPPQGFILGTVSDEKTGEPVSAAMVSYSEGAKTPQATGSQGKFRSYGFEPGKEIALSITHPDYEPAEAKQMLDGEGEVELAVTLKPVPKKGTVGGVVIDQEGEPIANATIKLTGADTATVTTGQDGKFLREVSSGDYTVAASAPEYLTGGRDATVASDKELQLEITLKPEPKEKLVEVQEDRIRIKQKVFFETGKAKILPRSYNVLNQVASVLLETPRIKKLRIEGHTDDVGAADYNQELSKQRADSVRAYLIEQGVGTERLSARGVGETEPLVPNTSKRNRSLNRRVEFRIVDQGLDE